MTDRLASIRAAVTSFLVMVTIAILFVILVGLFILTIGVIWGRLFGTVTMPVLCGLPAVSEAVSGLSKDSQYRVV